MGNFSYLPFERRNDGPFGKTISQRQTCSLRVHKLDFNVYCGKIIREKTAESVGSTVVQDLLNEIPEILIVLEILFSYIALKPY